ncbi:MAG: prolyl oligopeptidase family serine peptidase [Bacteroidota bacterium]
MKYRLLPPGFILLALIFGSVARGQQHPPILDREVFFASPEISSATISPDGRFVTFLKSLKGVQNIWIKERRAAFSKARPLTAYSLRPVTSYFWTQNGRSIVFTQDIQGNGNYRVYAIDPSTGGKSVPKAKDITPLDKIHALILDVPEKSPGQIIVGLNDRNPDWYDVYRINVVNGEWVLLRRNDAKIERWVTDLQGRPRLGIRSSKWGGYDVFRADPDSFAHLFTLPPEEDITPLRFTPDGRQCYVKTNKGSLDQAQLLLLDVATGALTPVEGDPLNEADFGGAFFSRTSDELLATTYLGDRLRVYPKQQRFAEDWANLTRALPNGDISITDATSDENLWMVVYSSDVDPGSSYLYDRTTGKVELLFHSWPQIPSERLSPMKSFRYTASDSLSIPAYLVTPRGIPAKNLPTILLAHEGPWSRVTWGYNPEAQFLANRGYAVVLPNYRGSSGYGKKFLNAGNREWGTGRMQQDITDCVHFVVASGTADPKRVGIFGGRFGGFIALSGVAFTPDLFAAAVSYTGPSSVHTIYSWMLTTMPVEWRWYRKMLEVRVGSTRDSVELNKLLGHSPLYSAEKIRSPLLIIQGGKDAIGKKFQSDQIVRTLRDLGRTVEYLLAEDEGSRFKGYENQMASYAAIERFLAKHLHGRYQKSLRPELRKKLGALTVDIKTVTAPKREEPVVPVMAAFRGSELREDTLRYAMTLKNATGEANGSSIRTLSATTSGGKKIWRIIETVKIPGAVGIDTLDIECEQLLPIRRSHFADSTNIVLNFTPDSVDGKIVEGSNVRPLHIRLDGPVLTDGWGTELAVSTLPLVDGKNGSIQVLDLLIGKARTMTVKLTGSENISIGGKSILAERVEIIPEGSGGRSEILWISKEDRRILKTEVHLPVLMGGGTVTSELTP